MRKPCAICCPLCGEVVGTYDGRTSTNPIYRCKSCDTRVLYRIETEESVVLPKPQRVCSSGVTFC